MQHEITDSVTESGGLQPVAESVNSSVIHFPVTVVKIANLISAIWFRSNDRNVFRYVFITTLIP